MKTFGIPLGSAAAVIALLAVIGCGESIVDDGTDGGTSTSEFTVLRVEDGLADPTVTAILVDHLRGGIWCATLNGVSFYSKADSSLYSFGAEYDIPKMETTSLALDYLTGRVWLGTASGPAFFSDSTWTALADMDSLIHRYIASVAVTANGSVWFGTKGGASVWEYLTGWTSYTTVSGLAGDNVTSIAFDAANKVWVASSDGIGVFDGDVWKKYGATVLPSASVNVVYRAFDGTMWCGTAAGITVYDGSKWSRYGTYDGLPSPGVNDIVEDWNRKLWTATDSGVAGLDGGKWKKLDLPDSVENERFLCVAADVIDGILWIGTTNGLVKYDPK